MSTFLTSFEPIYFVKMSLIFSVRYSSISNSMTFSFKPGHTVRKSRNITEQNRSPIFFYVVLKMLWNIMEKELTSCMGVLLRADLTHPFWQKSADWLNWLCPVRSALKRTSVQDFNSFSIMFYCIISITYKEVGDLF